MATEHVNQPVKPVPTPVATPIHSGRRRALAIATACVFCVSSAFPAVAAFVTDTAFWPKWWGVLDVGIAFLLAMLAIAVIGFAQGKVNKQAEEASYRVYRVLLHGIFVILVVFFLFGDRIVWTNCLTGFAWRTWLLLYSLPAWFTMFGANRPGNLMAIAPQRTTASGTA